MNRAWSLLAWLPKTHGYAFEGLRHDGTTVRCRVERGPDGMHRVVGEAFKNLRAWRPVK